MTDGSIFGHSNVGHIVRDPQVAAQYLAYWNKLKENPAMNRKKDLDQIRYWNQDNSPVPDSAPPADSITAIFSPRPTIQALKWYRDLMDKAETAVFLTAAFGVNELFEEVFAEERDYLRYILLEKKEREVEDMEKLMKPKYCCGRQPYLHQWGISMWISTTISCSSSGF